MLTGARQNRNIVLTLMLGMAVLLLGGFVLFAEPEGESEPVVPSIGELELPEPVELPESVRVPILVYHHVRPQPPGLSASDQQYTVTPEALAAHLQYLQDNDYTGVLLTDIRAALLEGAPLPDKPVAITFDDGRDNQFAVAYPLLEQYGFVATFSPFTNAIGRPGYVTWEQLAELSAAGHAIGSHAIYHPYMTKLADDELQQEASGSRAVLEDRLGQQVTVFAHPFGLYDDRTNAALEAAGYTVARGLRHTSDHTRGDLMSLGSYIATESLSYLRSIVGEQ